MDACLANPFEDFPATPEGRLAFLQWLVTDGEIIQPREISGHRWAGIKKFAFTWAITTGPMLNTVTVSERWCYHDPVDAVLAFEEWDGTGEPEGWHRHPTTGRRRNPDGGEVIIW